MYKNRVTWFLSWRSFDFDASYVLVCTNTLLRPSAHYNNISKQNGMMIYAFSSILKVHVIETLMITKNRI